MKRIYAGIIDYIIVGIIQSVLMFLFFIIPLQNSVNFNILVRMLIITYCSMIYFVIRDILGKKSIGKRILKLKIIDKGTGNEVNVLRRFIRNITLLLGLIDILVFFITKERIGDKIAKTNVVAY